MPSTILDHRIDGDGAWTTGSATPPNAARDGSAAAFGGKGCGVDGSKNVTGTRLTCTNADCECELQINTPCPHGSTYTCACGRPFEPVS
jgi:hypothetical protein